MEGAQGVSICLHFLSADFLSVSPIDRFGKRQRTGELTGIVYSGQDNWFIVQTMI